MNEQITNKFIDLIEGRLSDEERKELLSQIEASPELDKQFRAYQELVSLENKINQNKFELNANFSVKVMESIQNEYQHTFIRRLIMQFTKSQRIIFSGVATTALLLITLKIYQENPEVLTRQPYQANLGKDEMLSSDSTKKNELPSQDQKLEDLDSDTPITNALIAPIVQKQDNSLPESRVAKENTQTQLSQKPTKDLSLKLAEAKQASAPSRDDKIAGSTESAFDANKKIKAEVFGEGDIYYENEPGAEGGAGIAPDGTLAVSGEVAFETRSRFTDSLSLINNSNERYATYTENPIIAVQQEAISTFSIDVDTGSYTNTRRFLRMGQMPPTDSIRVEEFINYFKYDYPAQYEKPFSLNYEFAPSPLEKEKFLLKLGIKAKEARIEEKPWHLVFLIDVSGSMQADDKLGLVKQSLTLLTNKMRPTDKVSIVTYAGSAGTLLAGTSINNKDQILKAIEGLTSGGSTYGSAGIQEAYQLASTHFMPNGVNRVILATDGDFNVGTTSTEELVKLISEKRKSNITLTTIGFGTGNYNEGMMEQLANKGNGNYFYIDSFGEARKVFEQDLFGTIEVVAKDVKLQIEFNPEHVSHYRLIGYDNRLLKKEDFNNDQIDAGEIGSSHTVTALYEVVLTGTALAEKLNLEYRYQHKSKDALIAKKELSSELAFLKVRFKAPTGDKSELLTFPIVKSEKEPSSDFMFVAATNYFAALLRQSQFLGNYSYADVLKLAEDNLGHDKEGYRREMVELIKNAQSLKK